MDTNDPTTAAPPVTTSPLSQLEEQLLRTFGPAALAESMVPPAPAPERPPLAPRHVALRHLYTDLRESSQAGGAARAALFGEHVTTSAADTIEVGLDTPAIRTGVLECLCVVASLASP